MVLNRINQRRYYQNLYRGTGSLVSITFRKRGDDQSQGTVTDYVLAFCRVKKNFRAGENIEVSMTSSDATVWQIPLKSLEDAGCTKRPVQGDMILDNIDTTSEFYGQTWMVESTETITQQLFGDVYNLQCLRHS